MVERKPTEFAKKFLFICELNGQRFDVNAARIIHVSEHRGVFVHFEISKGVAIGKGLPLLDVMRRQEPVTVTVHQLDNEGEDVVFSATGYDAKAIEHSIDFDNAAAEITCERVTFAVPLSRCSMMTEDED